MSPSLRNLRIFPLIILISYLQPCRGAPFLNALPSLQTVQTAMERVADYGYQMLGYEHHADDDVIVKDKKTLWDGHIEVPDFVSPLIAAIPEYNLNDMYGNERVVKGHDGRLGFRVAVPYFGDLQYVREYGPGRFTDKLGPGNYKYPGLDARPTQKPEEHHYYAPEPSYDHKPQQTVYPEQMYQGLKHYPWNVNK